jgi:hypothetical protein
MSGVVLCPVSLEIGEVRVRIAVGEDRAHSAARKVDLDAKHGSDATDGLLAAESCHQSAKGEDSKGGHACEYEQRGAERRPS